jgi:phosphoglucomutase
MAICTVAYRLREEMRRCSAAVTRQLSPPACASQPAVARIDVADLIRRYSDDRPDPNVAAECVAFGTSGHRGTAFNRSFNEWHVLATTQAICDYRRAHDIQGPLFVGLDTHALSAPARDSALEVLAANGVDVMLAIDDEYTPTPAVSHAILAYNRTRHHLRNSSRADGIVLTPSHNPPRDGGIKYNLPHGGPADTDTTRWIEAAANQFMRDTLVGVRRMPLARALRAATTHRHDYLGAYVADLGSVIDMQAIANATLRIGVDPMGGAGVHYWPAIAKRYRLDITVLDDTVDPTFGFLPPDSDGQIRMDPSSPCAMRRLIDAKDRFDVAMACDTDHDRYGIVTPRAGLLPTNHSLCVFIDYLFQRRPHWSAQAGIGKSVVTTQLVDRLAHRLHRPVLEVPVGFKWFVAGLLDGRLGFAGEESAGASFLRRDGTVWTTDKDGIAAALLAAEITATTGRDVAALYADVAAEWGHPVADRIAAPATAQQRQQLAALTAEAIHATTLAGERVEHIESVAPGNHEPIGGIKVSTANGWFAARPSGTEALYKIYAESFQGPAHLQRLLAEAHTIVDAALAAAGPAAKA